MEKFTVYIDMKREDIEKGYKHYFGTAKKPTKKDIASWISILAEADILDCTSFNDENDEDDEDISIN